MYPESVKASPSSNGTKESSKEEDSNPPEVCTKEQLSKIAENLGDKWPKLIPKLGLTADDEEKFKKDGKTDKGIDISFELDISIYEPSKFSSLSVYESTEFWENNVIDF